MKKDIYLEALMYGSREGSACLTTLSKALIEAAAKRPIPVMAALLAGIMTHAMTAR